MDFKYFVYVFKLKKLDIDNKKINIKCPLPWKLSKKYSLKIYESKKKSQQNLFLKIFWTYYLSNNEHRTYLNLQDAA